jgi:hypothetical protein
VNNLRRIITLILWTITGFLFFAVNSWSMRSLTSLGVIFVVLTMRVLMDDMIERFEELEETWKNGKS